MAVQQRELACCAALVAVCIYAFIAKSFGGIYGTIANVMFLVTGGLGVAMSTMDTNQDLTNAYKHAFFVSQAAGVDLFMVDICLAAGVDQTLALLNLVPPIVDIVMKYFVDENWKLVTPMTHIVSMILMCYFGFRDGKYVLFIAAIGFILAIAHYKHDVLDTTIIHPLNAIGVFFVSWSLAGKDLEDLGIPFPEAK